MNPLGRHQFRFAVLTDAHVTETEHGNTSPFPVNRLSTARYRHVVNLLNEHDVDFILNLGDMVHPLPSLPTYAAAAEQFHEISAQLRHKQYFIPGNHDIGDKPSDWMPAAPVDENAIATFRKHFGADYQQFEHKGIVFLLLNAELVNSDLPAAVEQTRWLEQVLQDSRGRRIMMTIHYPPFLCETDEPDHYDNIAEPGRSWLLGILERYKVEAVFSGHVHNFWLNWHGETALYIVPSVAFPRQDYSEMYETEPEPEGGRNDENKLGYFTVDVFEKGHTWAFQRTFGIQQSPTATYVRTARTAMQHPLLIDAPSLGMDMRHRWISYHEIPPSGALDEFHRKQARNDYPVLALCELGVRDLRIPVNDLIDARVRSRLRELRAAGFRYTSYMLGEPDARVREALADSRDLLEALEIAWPEAGASHLPDAVERVRDSVGDLPIYISPLWSEHGRTDPYGRHFHVINHAFPGTDERKFERFWPTGAPASSAQGAVFVIDVDADFIARVQAVSSLAAHHDLKAHVLARHVGVNPAEWQDSPEKTAAAAVVAQIAARECANVKIFFDSFVDIDRGYFRRRGLVDRQFNPRAGWHALRAMREAQSRKGIRVAELPAIALAGWNFQMLATDRSFCLLATKLGAQSSARTSDQDAVADQAFDVVDLTRTNAPVVRISRLASLPSVVGDNAQCGPCLCSPVALQTAQ